MFRWVRGGGPVPHGGSPHLFLRDIKFVEIFIHIVILLLKNTFNLLNKFILLTLIKKLNYNLKNKNYKLF